MKLVIFAICLQYFKWFDFFFFYSYEKSSNIYYILIYYKELQGKERDNDEKLRSKRVRK
jgi:hypothetical protein